MQPKESKSKTHFYFSITKSFIRFIACVCLAYQDFTGTALLFGLAEVLGIVEEF